MQGGRRLEGLGRECIHTRVFFTVVKDVIGLVCNQHVNPLKQLDFGLTHLDLPLRYVRSVFMLHSGSGNCKLGRRCCQCWWKARALSNLDDT